MVVLLVRSRISIIKGVQGIGLEAFCPFGEVLCAQKCHQEDGVAKCYAIWEVHLSAEQNLQNDKRKGKAQWLLQFAMHKSNCYVKALQSGSTEQAGLYPTAPAYKEQVFSRIPEAAGQFKKVCSLPCCFQPLCAFVWLPQK